MGRKSLAPNTVLKPDKDDPQNNVQVGADPTAKGTISIGFNQGASAIERLRKAKYDVLISGKANSGSPILDKILEKQVKMASVNAESLSAQRILKNMDSWIEDGEAKVHKDDLAEFQTYQIWKHLSQDQRNWVFRKSNNRLCVLSRRSGKTFAMASILVLASVRSMNHNKPRKSLYCGLTITKAINIIWPAILEVCKWINIKPKKSDDIIKIGKAEIICAGLASAPDIEKLRGNEFSVAIIDEIQSQKGSLLETFIKQVLTPTFATYFGVYDDPEIPDTLLLLTGTPDYSGAGSYIKSFKANKAFDKLTGTLLSNPTIKDPVAFIRNYLEVNGMPYTEKNTENPLERFECNEVEFQREILGMDVEDTTRLVFPLIQEAPIPPKFDKIWGGVDVGFVDQTSIVLLGQLGKEFWVLYCESGSGWGDEEIKNRIKKAADFAYQSMIVPDHFNFYIDHNAQGLQKDINTGQNRQVANAVTIDLNFLGEGAIDNRYLVKLADKTHKTQAVTNLSFYLRTGKIKIDPKLTKLLQELRVAKWELDGDGSFTGSFDDEQWTKGSHGDSVHGLLYAWNAAYKQMWQTIAGNNSEIPMSPMERVQAQFKN
jgi:hypothetical protein